MRRRALTVVLAALMLLGGCDSPVTVEAGWLDGPDVNDPSLTDASYRVFTRLLGRDPATVSETDRRRQMDAFQEMIQKVSQ
jgi:hypothetical protein